MLVCYLSSIYQELSLSRVFFTDNLFHFSSFNPIDTTVYHGKITTRPWDFRHEENHVTTIYSGKMVFFTTSYHGKI